MNQDVHPQAFEGLLTAYLNEQISDIQWDFVCQVLDSQVLFKEERQAFASFVTDAVSTNHVLRPPTAKEAGNLMDQVRFYPYRLAAN